MEYPKLISWSYRTGRGLFTSKNDKDFVLLYYVKNAETEAKIKQLGYIPSTPFGPDYPFVTVGKEWGNTQRARSYGKIEKEVSSIFKGIRKRINQKKEQIAQKKKTDTEAIENIIKEKSNKTITDEY